MIRAELDNEEMFRQEVILDKIWNLFAGMLSSEELDGVVCEQWDVEVGSGSGLIRIEERVCA